MAVGVAAPVTHSKDLAGNGDIVKAMPVKRVALDQCHTKGCSFTQEQHSEWMEACSRAPEHGHWHDQPTHQHWPKKGMGGNNSRSKIVAILCWPMHDRIDNKDWGNALLDLGNGTKLFRVWGVHNETILEKEVMPTAARNRVRLPNVSPIHEDQREVGGRDAGLATSAGDQTVASPKLAEDSGSSALVGAGGEPGSVPTPVSPDFSPALLMDAGGESEGGAGLQPIITTPQPGSGQPSPRPPSAFTLEDWMEQGRCLRDEGLHLRKLTTEWAFRVGDWWNSGEAKWPHESSQMMDELGLSYWQITKFASVAGRVPPENRLSHDILTVEHYRAVANLPPEGQAEALEMAVEDGMSASGLKIWLAEKNGATAVVVPERERCICPTCKRAHYPLVAEEWKA